MISNKALSELVAAMANQLADRVFPDEPRMVVVRYGEIESAPDIDITWDSELEVIRIEVKS